MRAAISSLASSRLSSGRAPPDPRLHAVAHGHRAGSAPPRRRRRRHLPTAALCPSSSASAAGRVLPSTKSLRQSRPAPFTSSTSALPSRRFGLTGVARTRRDTADDVPNMPSASRAKSCLLVDSNCARWLASCSASPAARHAARRRHHAHDMPPPADIDGGVSTSSISSSPLKPACRVMLVRSQLPSTLRASCTCPGSSIASSKSIRSMCRPDDPCDPALRSAIVLTAASFSSPPSAAGRRPAIFFTSDPGRPRAPRPQVNSSESKYTSH